MSETLVSETSPAVLVPLLDGANRVGPLELEDVVEVATVTLQRGDRVLFYTDGLTESRSPDTRELFGIGRRLSKSILEYTGGLDDDATLVLLEYHGSPRAA